MSVKIGIALIDMLFLADCKHGLAKIHSPEDLAQIVPKLKGAQADSSLIVFSITCIQDDKEYSIGSKVNGVDAITDLSRSGC